MPDLLFPAAEDRESQVGGGDASPRLAVHPLLAAALAALDCEGTRYCLLRGERDLARPEDVDLLVAADDLDGLRRTLAPLGYAAVPSWGRGSHRICVGFDDRSGDWLKLDLVTDLAFGRYQELRCAGAAACLERRVRADGVALLAAPDRFWALLLHCLLDRGHVEDDHAARLRELAQGDALASPLANEVGRRLPPDWTVERVAAAARAGDWAALERLAAVLSRRWRGPGARMIAARNRSLRRLGKPLTMLRRRGLRVALLGPDGTGKSTLAATLTAWFFFPARTFYGGLYPARSGGRRPPKGIGLLVRFSRLRYRSAVARAHQLRGRLVVFDRYPFDASLTGAQPATARARLRRAILRRACSRPDVIVVLDAPPELSFARKGEHDVAALARQRDRYRELATTLRQATLVDAARTPSEVVRAVTALVWRETVKRGRWR